MKFLFSLSSVLLHFFLGGDAYADFTGKGHVHTRSETKQVFLNPDCRSSDTCDLKRFSLTTSVDEIWFSDDPNHPTYRNGVIMEYETDSVEALEKYAIVQFIKGCVFYSSKKRDGTIARTVNSTVPSFGEEVPLCFPKWVIDSQDTDPAYNSDPAYGRFYLLRWNKPGSYDYRQQKYYGAERPQVPVVYMTDYPAGAFVTASDVKNAALRFRTCIYRARDIPAETHRDNTEFANPLACLEWQNVHVYDFDKRQFEPRWIDFPVLEPPNVLVAVFAVVIFIAVITTVALFSHPALKLISQPKKSLILGFGSCAHAGAFSNPLTFQDSAMFVGVFVVAVNLLAGALIAVSGFLDADKEGRKRKSGRETENLGRDFTMT